MCVCVSECVCVVVEGEGGVRGGGVWLLKTRTPLRMWGNVPEEFAESSPCRSNRPHNCLDTPNKSSTDLASHNDERASPIPSEQLVREETMTNCCQTWVPGASLASQTVAIS